MVDLKSSPFLFARKWWIREWITFSIWSRKKLFWRYLIWKDEILSKIINWILIIIRNKILYAPMMKFIGKRVKRLYSPPINSWILLNKNRYKISTLFSSPSSNRFSRWRNVMSSSKRIIYTTFHFYRARVKKGAIIIFQSDERDKSLKESEPGRKS